MHIKQKNNIQIEAENVVYTVVVTTGWEQPLEDHPSIKENPNNFEIVAGDPPDNVYVQYLKYI